VRVEHDWWQADGAATVEFSADGVFTYADEAACALVDLPPGTLVGRHWRDLVPPTARPDDGAWVWEVLDAGRVVQSVFDLPLATGGYRVIEYRTERVGTGRFRSHWRPFAMVEAGSQEMVGA
jgi:PAS domain-containing protein